MLFRHLLAIFCLTFFLNSASAVVLIYSGRCFEWKTGAGTFERNAQFAYLVLDTEIPDPESGKMNATLFIVDRVGRQFQPDEIINLDNDLDEFAGFELEGRHRDELALAGVTLDPGAGEGYFETFLISGVIIDDALVSITEDRQRIRASIPRVLRGNGLARIQDGTDDVVIESRWIFRLFHRLTRPLPQTGSAQDYDAAIDAVLDFLGLTPKPPNS